MNKIIKIMKYLKKFNNHTEYAAAKQDLILPNVSLCTQENEVHYNPYVDPYNGHEYVDLGLPSGTKWATMNVGASSETDYGNYYQYGKGVAQYADDDNYYLGTEDPLDSSVDTATQVWGGSWHMPTRVQMQELIDNTTYQWVEDYQGSGINGGTFTATNGTFLFLPAAGGWDVVSIGGLGSFGYYWSSSPNGSSNVFYMNFANGGKGVYGVGRNYGYSVRPVVG